jgi:hypothetical protein
MSRRARLLRKHRRLMRWIAQEEVILGRTAWLSRMVAMKSLRGMTNNVRGQRWR